MGAKLGGTEELEGEEENLYFWRRCSRGVPVGVGCSGLSSSAIDERWKVSVTEGEKKQRDLYSGVLATAIFLE